MSEQAVVAGIGDPGREARSIMNSTSPASPPPSTDNRVHKHLRRLERVWIDRPIYFITTCTFRRRAILARNEIAATVIDEWRSAHDRHGWAVGRYVIMPDHVHLFCRAELDAKSLPIFMQKWKEWSSKRMARELKVAGRIWQEEFFDHVLRSSESYSHKWDYVKENPVRAELVKKSDDWPFQGEIESLML
jgi:REP element-mobilizing transposase RayT